MRPSSKKDLMEFADIKDTDQADPHEEMFNLQQQAFNESAKVDPQPNNSLRQSVKRMRSEQCAANQNN